MQVIEDEVTATRRNLVGVTCGVVVDVVAMPGCPPILLGLVELAGDLRMPLEGQDPREGLTVGESAIPAVADIGFEDLDDLSHQEPGGEDWVGEDVHAGAGTGHAAGAARVRIGINVEGKAGRGQAAEPLPGRLK